MIDIPDRTEPQVQQHTRASSPPGIQKRHSLIDKKRLKWEQDITERQNLNPYKKTEEVNLRPQVSTNFQQANTQENLNTNIQLPVAAEQQHSFSSNRNQKSERAKENLAEYKRINDTLAKIVEAENKIKQEQIEALRLQVLEQQAKSAQNTNTSNFQNMSDQKMIPAAMRTSVVFGVSSVKNYRLFCCAFFQLLTL